MKSNVDISINQLSETECKSLIEGGEVVVILGSFISTWAPSNLIAGKQFSEALFEILFKDKHGNYFETTIDDELIRDIYFKLPFEVINSKCPNQKEILSVIQETYSIQRSNKIHKLFAKLLLSKNISAIITTNYDNCLERSIDRICGLSEIVSKSKVRRVVDKNDLFSKTDKDESILFKIHGSVEQEKSLIYNLDQEGVLVQWKRTLFHELIHNKIVLIIGYSGLDFDICQEISIAGPKKVLWNYFSKNDVTINSRILQKKVEVMRIYGDMGQLLSKLYGPIKLQSSNKKSNSIIDLRNRFSEEEILLWQVSILNALSYSVPAIKIAQKMLQKKNSDPVLNIKLMSELGGALAPSGKYCDSGNVHLQAAKIAKKYDLDSIIYFRQLNCASDAFRGSGAYFRSWILHNEMKHLGSLFPPNNPEMKFLIIRNEILLKHVLFRFMGIIKAKSILSKIQDSVKKQIEEITPVVHRTGNYYILQQLKLWANRFEISVSDIHLVDDVETLQPQEGYQQLFFQLGIIMDFRFRMNNKKVLHQEDLQQARAFLITARKLGINPEVWKLLRFIHDKFPQEFSRADRIELRRTFTACQYTINKKIEKLIIGY